MIISCGVVRASYGIGGSSVGCQASTSATQFDGQCVGLEPPTTPTQPAADHPWLVTAPSAAPTCSPYETTVWAAASGQTGGGAAGSIWALGGQRVPILHSTPLVDFGWVFMVTCGDPGTVVFERIAEAARTPSPCTSQTALAACLPGLNAGAFLADVEGHVPSETIEANPGSPGVVGVPVEAQLLPEPITVYAEIDVTVPDLGDGDPGESLHVVWVVAATPQVVSWTWPDGSDSSPGTWVPQTYVEDGTVRASLVYDVTATGFWSDGVNVHDLPSVSVGTIPIAAQLPYSVEQIQAGLS